MKKILLFSLLSVSILILASGCGFSDKGNVEGTKVTIEKDKAHELELELGIGAGELNVEAGANEWVEGTIEVNHKKLKTDVSYKLRGDKGIGVIKQDDGFFNNINFDDFKNKWDLKLNNEIPTTLIVNSGAALSHLDLKGLNLSTLEVNAGVGDMTIDLGGKWEKSFDASLEMGVGKSTIILPKEVGVKIISSKGIGNTNLIGFISEGDGVYVNEAFKDADVIINLTTELGIGEVNFQME